MSEEWGPWIEHDGLRAPDLRLGVFVQCQSERNTVEFFVEESAAKWKGWFKKYYGTRDAKGFFWDTVRRYRVRKPRGLIILEGLLEELPEGVNA